MAPERLLVFEVRGSIQDFAAAVRQVPGLELVDEEELASSDGDKNPQAYLVVPDARALAEILSLWVRWSRGDEVATTWRNVFGLLRAIRPWGPNDRVDDLDRAILAEEADLAGEVGRLRLEVELVFRRSEVAAASQQSAVEQFIQGQGGRILAQSRIAAIAYHALLVELPVEAVRQVVNLALGGIAGLEPIMHVRPQAVSFSLETADPNTTGTAPLAPTPAGASILALLDGVPVAQHPLLANRIRVEDPLDLEDGTPVADRTHGTAMASLVIHGDRNKPELPLPRPIVCVPMMRWDGSEEGLPTDRLIVDAIYRAILALKAGESPLAPNVVIVNISLGNRRKPFSGRVSPWARLLDGLAWEYGLLFIVSAGNTGERFTVPAFQTSTSFEDAVTPQRAEAVISAVHGMVGQRRIISPAETVNGVTIGASNEDNVPPTDRRTARVNVDPYPGIVMPNPSSRVGPGFANAIKPDLLMPGSREHLGPVLSGGNLTVQPARAARSFGLKVAAPFTARIGIAEHYTSGTSAAAALASRACHRIHDALEQTYGPEFLGLPNVQRALLLKALLAHVAAWPDDAVALIHKAVGPSGSRWSAQRKDNVRRYLGYGTLDPDNAVACAADRATFWATGFIQRDQSVRLEVPIPMCLGSRPLPHSVSATLAWFTPVQPMRSTYRGVRMSLLDSDDLVPLRVKPPPNQPDANQIRRGTLLSRTWQGDKAAAVTPNMVVRIVVQRQPDQGKEIDEPVPFGLAITLSMPGAIEIYDQVRTRLTVPQRIRP